MLNRRHILTSSLALFASTSQAGSWFGPQKVLHSVTFGNVEAYDERARKIYELAGFELLSKLVENRELPSKRNEVVEIILASEPAAPIFSGGRQQLYDAASDILDAIEPKPRCNPMDYQSETAWHRIELLNPDEIRTTIVGPMIHVPAGCSNAGDIILPQNLGHEIRYGQIAADPRTTEFRALMVHPLQTKPTLDHLKSFGAADRISDGDLSVEIHTADGTLDALNLRGKLAAAEREES